MTERTERTERVVKVSTAEFRPDSLIGSFFLADADRGWQGCVVAEPSPGCYLVELFDWIVGGATHQQLVRIEEMSEWRFFDNTEWLTNDYEQVTSARWRMEASTP